MIKSDYREISHLIRQVKSCEEFHQTGKVNAVNRSCNMFYHSVYLPILFVAVTRPIAVVFTPYVTVIGSEWQLPGQYAVVWHV